MGLKTLAYIIIIPLKLLKIILVLMGQLFWRILLFIGIFIIPPTIFILRIFYETSVAASLYGLGLFKRGSLFMIDTGGQVLNKTHKVVNTVDAKQNESVKHDWKTGKDIFRDIYRDACLSARKSFSSIKSAILGRKSVHYVGASKASVDNGGKE